MKFEIVAGDPRTIHRDKRIPLKVRGLFDLILGLPLYWNFSISNLMTLCPDSKESITACLKVLVQFKYAKKFEVKKKSGKRVKVIRFYESGNYQRKVVENGDISQKRLPGFDPRPTLKQKLANPAGPVHEFAHQFMYKMCFAAETTMERSTLTSTQRSRVASILGRLNEAGADLNDLVWFEKWWGNDWRSRDRITKQYQSPRPDQVLEHWWTAVKSRPIPPKVEHSTNTVDFQRMHAIMAQRALGKKQP